MFTYFEINHISEIQAALVFFMAGAAVSSDLDFYLNSNKIRFYSNT